MKNTTGAGSGSLESVLRKQLGELEVRPSDIMVKTLPNRSVILQAAVPRGKPAEWIVSQLAASVEGTPYTLADCVFDEKKQSYTMQFASSSKNDPPLTLVVLNSDRYSSATALMAVIVENLENAEYQTAAALLSFPEPFSVSIAPVGKKASLMAQLAGQYKKEVIIRLPLEPAATVPPEFENTTIMVHFTREKIHPIIAGALRLIPDAKGFSNLWGSRGLEDSRLMAIVLDEMKKQHGYFIEAPAAKNSVAASAAASAGLPYAEMAGQLEKTAPAELIAEIKRWAAVAQVKGTIAVRAKAGRQLADALKTSLPFLRQNGIRLVYVSEIVKRAGD
ncbi:MAG TPA: divergent polysaccharide deacetylase family protein [Chitinivibrionales bacterium]|nr:divergent polysaccharide deacetylase family protein [Chitinivibrionales bacterium]